MSETYQHCQLAVREATSRSRISNRHIWPLYNFFSLLFFLLLAVGKDSTRSAILINRTQRENEGVQKKYWYDDVKLGMGGKEGQTASGIRLGERDHLVDHVITSKERGKGQWPRRSRSLVVGTSVCAGVGTSIRTRVSTGIVSTSICTRVVVGTSGRTGVVGCASSWLSVCCHGELDMLNEVELKERGRPGAILT